MKAIQLKILIYFNVRLIDCLLLFVWPRIIYPDSGNAIITVDRLALNVKSYGGDAATVVVPPLNTAAQLGDIPEYYGSARNGKIIDFSQKLNTINSDDWHETHISCTRSSESKKSKICEKLFIGRNQIWPIVTFTRDINVALWITICFAIDWWSLWSERASCWMKRLWCFQDFRNYLGPKNKPLASGWFGVAQI